MRCMMVASGIVARTFVIDEKMCAITAKMCVTVLKTDVIAARTFGIAAKTAAIVAHRSHSERASAMVIPSDSEGSSRTASWPDWLR